MMRALLLLIPILLLTASAEEKPLEYWLADGAPFWSWDTQTFEKEAAKRGYRWSQANRSSRAFPPKGTLFEKPVLESTVRFEDGSPHVFKASFFNRGDAEKPMTEAEFKSAVRDLIGTIGSTLRVSSRPGTNQSRRSDVRDDSRVWQRPTIKFELSYSFSPAGSGRPFRAEYITLTAREFSSRDIPSHARDRVNPYEVKKNVTRDQKTGDVWIANIPMVDQGPKGYCAAATSERILRLFGQEVDQHQIAQVANTTSGGGTSTKALKEALQAVGRQYGFHFDSHLEWEFKDFLDDVEDYNKLAEKSGARQINVPKSGTVMIADIYQKLDPKTWKNVKLDKGADYRKFKKKVKTYVHAGCPLAWSVQLGLFPESTPTGAGGHLRMIIGYNDKKDTIIYSDTWGRGHEKKEMDMDQAFTITSSLFSLEPKGLRL